MRLLPALATSVALLTDVSTGPALLAQQSGSAVPFISVTPDEDYAEADYMLVRYLRRRVQINLESRPMADHQNAIEELVRQSAANTRYVARLTSYPCVIAGLEGAGFEIIATHLSRATGGLTYRSYFVVRESQEFDFGPDPGRQQLVNFLRKQPRTFYFDDKFSSSSYFMPLNFFHSQGIFDLERGPRGTLIPIGVARLEPSSPLQMQVGSSDLVRAVAAGKADLAAVWDGTKIKFSAAEYPGLRFIPLETALPNDLLVASPALGKEVIARLRAAVRAMPCGTDAFPGAGDFRCWIDIEKAPEAREALAALRRLAVAQPAPVTVRIAPDSAAEESLIEPARQAVRLAGTEFVLFDPDFHRSADFDWKLRLIHDGALQLTSVVNGVDQHQVEPQVFRISFADGQEELTKRIVSLLHTRFNRIRYLWPFDNRLPTVIRDVGFALPAGSRVVVQRITWIDRDRNEFILGDEFNTKITLVDFYKFQFEPQDFMRASDTGDLLINPMSNATYRVVLVPPFAQKPLFRYLTAALVILFTIAGLIGVRSLYRVREPRVAPLVAS